MSALLVGSSHGGDGRTVGNTEERVWDFSWNTDSMGGQLMIPIETEARSLGLGGSFTFMCWVNIKNFNTSQQGDNAILGQPIRQGMNSTLHLIIRNRVPYFGFYGNDTSGRTVLDPNTWYHLCFVYDATLQRQSIYVNGVLDAFADGRQALNADGTVYYSRYAEGRGLNGFLACPRFWTAPLNEEQINKVKCLPSLASISRADLTRTFDAGGSSTYRSCSSNNLNHNGMNDISTGALLSPNKPPMPITTSIALLCPVPVLPPRPRHLQWREVEGMGKDDSSTRLEFAYLYNNRKFSDLTIKYGRRRRRVDSRSSSSGGTGDREMAAHRALLASRSNYFRAMFDCEMSEAVSGVVDLQEEEEEEKEEDYCGDAVECGEMFEIFMKLLYSYDFDSIGYACRESDAAMTTASTAEDDHHLNKVVALLMLAVRYDTPLLRKALECHMTSLINDSNIHVVLSGYMMMDALAGCDLLQQFLQDFVMSATTFASTEDI